MSLYGYEYDWYHCQFGKKVWEIIFSNSGQSEKVNDIKQVIDTKKCFWEQLQIYSASWWSGKVHCCLQKS